MGALLRFTVPITFLYPIASSLLNQFDITRLVPIILRVTRSSLFSIIMCISHNPKGIYCAFEKGLYIGNWIRTISARIPSWLQLRGIVTKYILNIFSQNSKKPLSPILFSQELAWVLVWQELLTLITLQHLQTNYTAIII